MYVCSIFLIVFFHDAVVFSICYLDHFHFNVGVDIV